MKEKSEITPKELMVLCSAYACLNCLNLLAADVINFFHLEVETSRLWEMRLKFCYPETRRYLQKKKMGAEKERQKNNPVTHEKVFFPLWG